MFTLTSQFPLRPIKELKLHQTSVNEIRNGGVLVSVGPTDRFSRANGPLAPVKRWRCSFHEVDALGGGGVATFRAASTHSSISTVYINPPVRLKLCPSTTSSRYRLHPKVKSVPFHLSADYCQTINYLKFNSSICSLCLFIYLFIYLLLRLQFCLAVAHLKSFAITGIE